MRTRETRDAPGGTEARGRFDVLIVGAGAAGLLAALVLLRRRPGTSVAIVEGGSALATRHALPAGTMQGHGGAGLYLGGRLFLGPATVPVLPPVSTPPGMRAILAGDAYMGRALAVDALLRDLGAVSPVKPVPDPPLAEAVVRAADAGLEYTVSYPSRPMTVDERRGVLARLYEDVRARGGTFTYDVQVDDLARDGEGFVARGRPAEGDGPETALAARAVLLAPGRYGAEWLVERLAALGATAVQLPVTYGVRIELAAEAYAPLTSINPDPRLQLTLPDDAVLKTYATCPGGLVTATERYGRRVASGVPLPLAERGANTTVALLLQPGVRGAEGPWAGGEAFAPATNALAGAAGVLVQRWGDVLAGRATTEADLAANLVIPTCPEAAPGTLHDIYDPRFWAAVGDFLARVGRLASGVAADDMLVYGPAEERFWFCPTDDALQTSVPGLFVAGDATGQSQGIIQAGVAGTLAGEGLAGALG